MGMIPVPDLLTMLTTLSKQKQAPAIPDLLTELRHAITPCNGRYSTSYISLLRRANTHCSSANRCNIVIYCCSLNALERVLVASDDAASFATLARGLLAIATGSVIYVFKWHVSLLCATDLSMQVQASLSPPECCVTAGSVRRLNLNSSHLLTREFEIESTA